MTVTFNQRSGYRPIDGGSRFNYEYQAKVAVGFFSILIVWFVTCVFVYVSADPTVTTTINDRTYYKYNVINGVLSIIFGWFSNLYLNYFYPKAIYAFVNVGTLKWQIAMLYTIVWTSIVWVTFFPIFWYETYDYWKSYTTTILICIGPIIGTLGIIALLACGSIPLVIWFRCKK